MAGLNLGEPLTLARGANYDDLGVLGGGALPAGTLAPVPMAAPSMDLNLGAPSGAVLGAQPSAPAGGLQLGEPLTLARGTMGESTPILGGPALAPGRLTNVPMKMPNVPGVVMPETTISGQPDVLTMPETTITARAPGAVSMPETTVRAPGQVSMGETTIGLPPARTAAERLERARVGEIRRQAGEVGGEMSRVEASFEAQKAAQAQINEAEGMGAQQAREAAEAEYGSALAAQGRAADLADARKLAAEAAERDYRDAQDALDNTKIDVEKAYGGTAGRIFAGLAVALGSFGASMTGGPNYAMQIVDSRINRELDAQRSELEKAKGKVGELGRILQNNQKLLGDAESARDLTQAQTYRALRAQIEKTQAAGTASARGQQMIQQLQDRENAAMQSLKERQGQLQFAAKEMPLVSAANREAAAAQAAARAAEEKRKDQRELQLFSDKEAVKAMFAGMSPEARDKAAAQTVDLGTKIHDKGYAAAARQYFELADNLGIDPITGKTTGKDPAGVGLISMGVLTPEGRINRQALNALSERIAKSFGGVVTESDRAAAEKLLKGAGTVEDIQRGLYMYGRGMAADLNVLIPGREQGFDMIAQRSPELARLVQVGQQQTAAKAAGFKPVGK